MKIDFLIIKKSRTSMVVSKNPQGNNPITRSQKQQKQIIKNKATAKTQEKRSCASLQKITNKSNQTSTLLSGSTSEVAQVVGKGLRWDD